MMFHIVFPVIAITLSAMCSLQAMDVSEISSLRKLCRLAIVRDIQSSEMLEKFAKGETKYHLLPQEVCDKIEKKLPGRPHRYCRIQQNFEIKKVVFNEKLQKCMMLGHETVYFANIPTGNIFHSFSVPGVIDILLSPDGDKCFFKCKGSFSGYDDYGQIFCLKQNSFIKTCIKECIFASFSPTGNELIIQGSTGLSLWNIDTQSKEYEGCQQIKFCSTGKRLLIKKSNIATVFDTIDGKNLLDLPQTVWAFLSNNGKRLFRQKGFLINKPLVLLSQLIDVDSGLLLQSANSAYMPDNPFSPDGAYVVVFCDNKYELWDVLSGDKKVSVDLAGMFPQFVLGGKYLFIKTPEDQLQIKKYGYVVLVNDFVAHGAKKKKGEVKIINVPKRVETHDSHNLLFSAFGDYVVHRLNKQVWLIDLFENKSFLFAKMVKRLTFSFFGRMLLLHKEGLENKNYVDIVRFDNDFTIEQFLFKKLIDAYHMTKKQALADDRWSTIYNSLSVNQKKHFDCCVFKEL